jgi:hypothetical protein
MKLDRYVYEEVYPAFKAATDEKAITAKVNRAFLNFLTERKLVFSDDSPAAIADIGCGPCDTLVKYLTGLIARNDLVVRATDYLPRYADSEHGEALKTLAAAKSDGVLKLASFAVGSGDAFAGKLSELLAGPHDGDGLRHSFRIVFASHVAYHAKTLSEVQRLLSDVADNLLAGEGVCIMYHLGNTAGTFQQFRARFGSEAGARTSSNTGAVTIDDPPAQIRAAAAANQLPFYETEFITRLRFGLLQDAEWEIFENPQRYDALAISNPAAFEDLQRLYFVVQRAPMEFAADHSGTGLHTFLKEIRAVIEANHGVLPLAERMQVLTRADAEPSLGEAIPEALAAGVASIGERG